MLAPARAQEFCEIVIVAVGRSDLAKTRGTRRVGGVAAHRKGWERSEHRVGGMSGERARGIRAGQHHRAKALLGQRERHRLDAQQRREHHLVPARAQGCGGALAVSLGAGH